MQTNGTKIEKEKSYEWEECRVLHGFGLCLLLSSHVLRVVLCYMHSNDLTLIVLDFFTCMTCSQKFLY